MKITGTNKNYFYFHFEKHDYNQYGYDHIRAFLNVFKRDFLPGERYLIKKMNIWAIKNSVRMKFNNLLAHYFDIKQRSIL